MSGCELTKRFIRKHSVHLGMHSRKEEMRKNIVELEVHLGDDLRLTGFGFAGVYTHQQI